MPIARTPITREGWALYERNTNNVVNAGDSHIDFRGFADVIEGGAPPHKEGSAGRVYAGGMEFFPQVYNLEWRRA